MKKMLIVLLGLTLISCSSQTKKEVRADKMKMGVHISKSEMIGKIKVSLEKIPGLSKHQKDRLVDLHSEVWVESMDINQEIRKHKVLLFKYIADNKYSSKKVNFVKKKIKKLYSKKMDLMLKSFDKVRLILGKDIRKILIHDDFRIYHGLQNERF